MAAEEMKPGAWIPVSSATEINGPTPAKNGAVLGRCHGGHSVEFGPLAFEDGLVDRVEIRIASPGRGGQISLHLGDQEQVAQVPIPNTGGYGKWAVVVADSEQLAGTHPLILKFHGGQHLANISAVRFLKPHQKGTENAIRPDPLQWGKELEKTLQGLVERHRPAIETHRTAPITVSAPPGATVRIRQQRHHFEFGTAINRNAFGTGKKKFAPTVQDRYKQMLLENFNAVVPEGAMKWHNIEPEQGQTNYDNADAIVEWAIENDLFIRGHCIYWGRDRLVPDWQKNLDDDALRRAIAERARDYMTRFRGKVTEHDMNNEMTHCHYYANRLGREIRLQMFKWCQQADPDARLYVNDYNIISGGGTNRYVRQIKQFLEAGAPVGGIGVQGHFGGKVNGPAVKAKLDRLAQFNLPIKITEYDANTADPNARTLALVTLYTTAFAHPAVDGIYMWGFWRGQHWRPRAAIWNKDWTPTSAANWYRKLVFEEWWTDQTLTVPDDGIIRTRVFFGRHELTVDDKSKMIEVRPDGETAFEAP